MDETLIRIGLLVIGVFIGKEIGVHLALKKVEELTTNWAKELKKGLEEKKT